MKLILCTLLLSVCAGLAGPAETKEAADLIGTLPTRERVVAEVALFKGKDVAALDERQREANESLTKALEGFARLKTLLQPKTSVFDYPGLLGLARIKYNEGAERYSFILGVTPGWKWAQPEGTNPQEFEVFFDNHGTITEIKAVRYKH
jgi:hypothetical protein